MQYGNTGVFVPFSHHMGFELALFEQGASQVDMRPRPEHLNSFGAAHGGVLMSLLDVCMSAAARSLQLDMGVVTIEMKTSFLRGARGTLAAKGRVIHRTATLAFTEATVFDADGRACAHGTGTFKYVRRSPSNAPAKAQS